MWGREGRQAPGAASGSRGSPRPHPTPPGAIRPSVSAAAAPGVQSNALETSSIDSDKDAPVWAQEDSGILDEKHKVLNALQKAQAKGTGATRQGGSGQRQRDDREK